MLVNKTGKSTSKGKESWEGPKKSVGRPEYLRTQRTKKQQSQKEEKFQKDKNDSSHTRLDASEADRKKLSCGRPVQALKQGTG